MYVTDVVMNMILAWVILKAKVAEGTLFENIPQEWTCPACGEEKDMFLEVLITIIIKHINLFLV